MTRRGEEGYVLAAALASLLAMSIVAAALVGATVSELRRVAAAERAAGDDAALTAAITLAATELVEEPRARILAFADGRERVAVGGREIDVHVGWESDRLDVNTARFEAIDARLAAAGLNGEDRAAIRRNIEIRRARGEALRLVDDALEGVVADACARAVLTVFGGRTDWTKEAHGANIAIGRPAPGSRIFVAAALAEGARGREAVLLVTGEPRAPVSVMDVRTTRGEGCDVS